MNARRRHSIASPAESLFALVERERDALDRLLADLVDGARSAAHYDALESQAQAIGVGLLAAFRQHRTR